MPTLTSDARWDSSGITSEAVARLVAVLNASIDAIITIDSRGIIDAVNPATERIFGYTADELLGNNVSMLMSARDARVHDRYLQNYSHEGTTNIIGIGREVEAQRKDGSVFPCDLAVTEFCIDGERMFTGILRDVSGASSRADRSPSSPGRISPCRTIVGPRTHHLDDCP